MPQKFLPPLPAPGRKSLIALVGGAAAVMLYNSIPHDEGVVLRGYRDPVGIATKCMGDTQSVVVGRAYSLDECVASMERQLIAHAEPVLRCVPGLKGRTNQLVASVSWAYNVGTGAFCRSAAAREFNAGNWGAGCQLLSKPVTARGQVLPGLVRRRQREVTLCLKGL